jgi:hypothetical protein
MLALRVRNLFQPPPVAFRYSRETRFPLVGLRDGGSDAAFGEGATQA